MGIIGFNFLKMNAERLNPPAGKIQISNNASIKEVTEAEFNFGKSKQPGVRFTFQFTSQYAPQIANIELTGEVLYTAEQKKCKEVVSSWKKKAKLPPDVITDVLNTIMTKCNVEALLMSRELNLPPPIQLPRISETQQEPKDYIG
ncbi:MAG: hypothetical protein EPN86_03970 [Nanoarchaeota archaeon]|nr:MAG: hypothetical protein EPN86_03970 [Nanoarchaeota archaeon]